MRARFVVLILLCFPWVGPANGQTTTPDTLFVSPSVEPGVVSIGERVRVGFTIAVPDSGARVLGPPAPITFGPVDVLLSTSAAAGPDSSGWLLEVAFFETGEHDLSAIPFMMEWGDTIRSIRLLPYTVSVESVLPDTLADATIRDITGLAPFSIRWRWWRIALTLAALLTAAAFLVWYRRRPRESTAVSVLRPSIPPEEAAILALRELADQGLPERGLQKEHYSRLSLILREYMERRLDLTALESTTEEIRADLDTRALPEGEGASIVQLLEEADLVKFARFETEREAATRALNEGRRWVETVGAWSRKQTALLESGGK